MATDWPRVSALFEAAVDLDPAAREALLVREGAADPRVTAEVRALLRAHDGAGSFLDAPAWAACPDLLEDDVRLSGRRIGPYQIQEEVGRGGMGVVYAAEDVRLGRIIALKALPAAYARDAVARERLSREARAAASLSHPSIATVYALEEIDGDLFIASELVRGQTLRADLAGGPLSRERLLDVVGQIAEALDAAHRQGIVHRDLKPENVLVAAGGRIKVVDFGIARSLVARPDARAGLTLTGTSLGTPGYMAPEQLRGKDVDARADVFAFGVMTYELATGSHPFGGSDPAALIERLVSDDPPLSRPILPSALDRIARRCLRGDPAARFASGTELLAALRAPDEVSAVATTAPGTAWWWQFHQVAVAILTIATVVTVGVRRHWIDPYGSAAFLAVLVLATISTTLRLHLWFVSQAQPAMLTALRGRVLRWIVFVEALLLACLLSFGLTVAGPHDGTAAWLVVASLLLALSLIVIEPATTRASLSS